MQEPMPSAESASRLPDGALALLFTDVEGSTAHLRELGDGYASQLEAHHRILRAAFAHHGGTEVDTQGDSFFAVFSSVDDALAAAVEAQRELSAFAWSSRPFRVRMSVHFGAPTKTREGYVGVDLHRGARLMSAGYGGQLLLSGQAMARAKALPTGCTTRDLGEQRLKNLPDPERVFQLLIDGVPNEFPPLRSLDNRPHNLPTPSSPILGREREIDALRAQLQAGARLLTLLGPGGTGKTRLSLEVAHRTRGNWENGAFFVRLAPVSAPDATDTRAVEDAIANTVARELNVRDAGTDSIFDALTAHLKEREMLLVLDNFEHLIGGANVIADWLAACPRLQILATSRVPLSVRGEAQVPVAPLSLPEGGPLPPREELHEYSAIALFETRARAVKPDFSLADGNASAVARICARLDGLPLAIELAAARVKVLPPSSMVSRLDKSLSFLTGGARDMAARQQTLRAAIAWSYDLLSPDEQRAFRRLGVFRGGFTLESAERVCAPPLGFEAPLDTFEIIASLQNQSLLVLREADEPRFGMLETIREFALEQLDASGEGDVLRERHLEWCSEETLARDAQMVYDLRSALQEFEREADNWRAAWSWSIGARPERALQLASEAALLWNRIGGTLEHYERLETALRAAPHGNPAHRCRALQFLVQADRNRTNWARYRGWLEELETVSREAELWEFQAIALDQRMWDEVGAHRHEAALQLCEQVVELRRKCWERAKAQSLGAPEIERCESEWSDARLLQVEILTRTGRDAEAWTLMNETLAHKRTLSNESGLTFGLYKLAQLLVETGRWAEARPIYEEVVQRAERVGDRSIVLAWYRHEAALTALHDHDTRRARELLRDSYAVWEEHATGAAIPPTLSALAWLSALEKDWPLTARALGAADAHGNTIHIELRFDVLEAPRHRARAALGNDEYNAQFALGTRLDAQAFIEAALMRNDG